MTRVAKEISKYLVDASAEFANFFAPPKKWGSTERPIRSSSFWDFRLTQFCPDGERWLEGVTRKTKFTAGAEIEFFVARKFGRQAFFDSLVSEFVARLVRSRVHSSAVWGDRQIRNGRAPRFTWSFWKAKIELCVTRQVFDFKNYRSDIQPCGLTASAEARQAMISQISGDLSNRRANFAALEKSIRIRFHGEFDSGSERTLAAWIRHASRTGLTV